MVGLWAVNHLAETLQVAVTTLKRPGKGGSSGHEKKQQRIRAARPQNTIMNVENKQRLSALRRRFPGKITLRAPEGATPVTLHAQAQAAARLEDILAHVTITETGRTTSRAVSLWDESRTWDPGD